MPEHNHVLPRALRALAHPLTLGSVVLLLINDHLLRAAWPGWWSGKLGDVAWLAFAPLLLAPLAALVWPRRPRVVLHIGVGSVGLGFTLANILPAGHHVALAALGTLTGWPSALRRDLTDLLALPALLLPVLIWRWAGRSPQRQGWRPLALPALMMGVLATLANSPAPDYGIDCLTVLDGGRIVALSSYTWDMQGYVSADGGLTWDTLPPDQVEATLCESATYVDGSYTPETWIYQRPVNAEIHYRFTPGERIERSTDGGETWQTERVLTGSQPRMAYYRGTRSGAYDARPGPLDAIYHPATNHLVVAMGHEGVLVRDDSAAWQWVAVGPYAPVTIDSAGRVLDVIGLEVWFAAGAGLLVIAALAHTRRRLRWWLLALLALGWLGWLIGIVLSPALHAGNYLLTAILLGGILLGVYALALAIWGVAWLARHQRGALLRVVGMGLSAVVLCALPYVLWATGAVPQYGTAAVFAVLFALATAAGGWWWLRAGLRPANDHAEQGED